MLIKIVNIDVNWNFEYDWILFQFLIDLCVNHENNKPI